MNEIQLSGKSLEEIYENQAPLELRVLLEEWKDEPKDRAGVDPGRVVPRFFDRYFQTFPMGMN